MRRILLVCLAIIQASHSLNFARIGALTFYLAVDYIFECSPSQNRAIKARNILFELQRKTAVYQSMRGMR